MSEKRLIISTLIVLLMGCLLLYVFPKNAAVVVFLTFIVSLLPINKLSKFYQEHGVPDGPNSKLKKLVSVKLDWKVAVGIVLASFFIFIAPWYHIMTDLPYVNSKGYFLIKRPYPGFSDIFASTEMCTGRLSLNYENHQSLCKALEREGIIYTTTDTDTKDRFKDEAKDYLKCIEQCDILSDDYADCRIDCL